MGGGRANIWGLLRPQWTSAALHRLGRGQLARSEGRALACRNGEAFVLERRGSAMKVWIIWNGDMTEGSSEDAATWDEAIAAWNRRTVTDLDLSLAFCLA
jgi:hypothetical protein